MINWDKVLALCFLFALVAPLVSVCVFRPQLVEHIVFAQFTENVQDWFFVWVRWYGVLNLLAFFAIVWLCYLLPAPR